MADLTSLAFDLADKYRMPAMLLADGTMGQMMEPVVLPEPKNCTVDKPWALTGTECKREHNIVNSLYLSPEVLERTNIERFERYKEVEKNETRWEEYMMEDAEYCIVAFGIAARVAKNAIKVLREKGIKTGLIRPITVWPFPSEPIRKAADKVKGFISVELSMGQMIEDVKLAEECKKPVSLCSRSGGMIPDVEKIVKSVEEMANGEAK